MTAATDHAAPDRERAETYLRLQAEAELRRAVAMPAYKLPREFRIQRRAFLTALARRMRHRRDILDRLMRQHARGAAAGRQIGDASQSRVAQSAAALPVIRHAAQSLARARTIAAPPTAAVLRAGASAGNRLGAATRLVRRHRRHRVRRYRRYPPPPAEACLTRVRTMAGVFAAVGAVTAETEEEIVAGLRAALAARSRIEQDALLGGYHRIRRIGGHAPVSHRFGGHRMGQLATGTAAPSGPPRAIPVGSSASGEIRGVPVRFYLGVLVFDHSGATLTVRARFPLELLDDDDRNMHPVYAALNEISAVDDRGVTYRAHFRGGGYGECSGQLQLTPALSAKVRWLDMTLPGAPAVRMRLDTPPRDLQITTEQVTTSAADRFLDAQTMQLLGRQTADPDEPDLADEDRGLASLFLAASDLVAAGVLRADSPSVRRLAAAGAQLGSGLPAPLAAVEPAGLPADWLSLLSRAGCTDGPVSAIPVAAVLPEVDGVQCVIVELVSDSESATMRVHARGWPGRRQPFGERSDQIWWSARDDLGGGYLVGEGGPSFDGPFHTPRGPVGEADLDLEISPAINPQARVLDIILSGTTIQVTVSVPLDWQEGS